MTEEIKEVTEEVVEAPVEETPVVEAPVEEAPAAETPVEEAPAKVEVSVPADTSQTMEDIAEEVEASIKKGAPRNDEPAWDKFEQLLAEKTIFEVKIEDVVKKGEDYKGVVAFVDEVRAFIPMSKLSSQRVENPEEFKGKTIEVIVADIDREKNKLILSGRDAARLKSRDARKEALAAIEVGAELTGKVQTIKEYGAFIDLGNGASGLVHISQISYKRVKSVEEALSVGDEVKVKVIEKDEKGKLKLSIKALTEPPKNFKNRDVERAPKNDDLVKDHKDGVQASTSLADLLAGIKL